ncbi:hypothetical protein [Dyella sp. GSA-30]|uniref:hypothetical protein n=1 Tax=Dyella sp. GSA-30 TaxID=2994496 RepID=UPI00248F51EB|nr:hypothetical protein [Dyella sp. GSA-30]BDU18969.1 hypothetical protein DYGSA30_04260 [Dyella sp. GSA-30]
MRNDTQANHLKVYFQQEFINFLRTTGNVATYSTACALLAQTTTTFFGSRRLADAIAICIALMTAIGAWFAVDLFHRAWTKRYDIQSSGRLFRLAIIVLVTTLIAAPWVVVREQIK